MTQKTRLLSIVCLGGLLLALGCASASTSPAPAAEEPQATPVAGSDRKAELALDDPGAPELEPIYFDTDQSLLRPEARTTLERYARVIQQHPEWGVVTIEGHCDERGSEEYNLALGGRRAAAVKQYLRDLGIPEGRLATRTFGEARPAVAGHDELAWQKNRRTELQSEARDSASVR